VSAACHLERVALYTHGAVQADAADAPAEALAPYVATPVAVECCEYCDATTLEWRKCKQICTSCGQINRSCADL
jgi:hypothetical protein